MIHIIRHQENRAEHKKNINKAISIFNAITCLDFQPATVGDIDRIQFIVGGGCWSYVGRIGGNQEVGKTLPFFFYRVQDNSSIRLPVNFARSPQLGLPWLFKMA